MSYNKSPDHIYYDVNYTNDGDKIIPMEVQQSRNTAIIENPEDYYVSVIRFTVPNKTIPIFLFPTTVVNDNIVEDNSYYSVTIQAFDGISLKVFKSYVKFQNTVFEEGYEKFGIYSYSNFLYMVNKALTDAWSNFTVFTALPIYAPYFAYYSSTGLIVLNVNAVTYATTIPHPVISDIQIFCNNNLLNFFQNFQGIFNGINTTNGKDFQFPTYDINSCDINKPVISSTPGSNSYVYSWTQEISCMATWNTIRSLVIQSSRIPSRDVLINGSTTQTNSETTSNYISLITDFEPQQFGQESRSTYQYYNQGEYRLLDLKGNQPIKDMDISVKWQDKYQKLHQVYMETGDYLSIKLLFVSKAFYHKCIIENLDYDKKDIKLIKN